MPVTGTTSSVHQESQMTNYGAQLLHCDIFNGMLTAEHRGPSRCPTSCALSERCSPGSRTPPPPRPWRDASRAGPQGGLSTARGPPPWTRRNPKRHRGAFGAKKVLDQKKLIKVHECSESTSGPTSPRM